MAEAQGPPRKTTTYNKYSTMASQNQGEGTKEDEFFWLENIMRVAPHKLHSIPGPRTVTFYPLPNPPGPCTDVTIRGQQAVSIAVAFDLDSVSPGTNARSSWGYIANGEVYALVGEATCGGGNMSYQSSGFPPPNCVEIYHYQDGNPVIHDNFPVPVPSGLSFINTRIGPSDVPIWAAGSNGYGGLRVYYSLGNVHVDYVTDTINSGGHTIDTYAIKSDEVWMVQGPTLDGGPGTPKQDIAVFDRLSGARLHTYVTWGLTDVVESSNMQLTTNFCYVLGRLNSTTWKIWKINRSDGTINATFDLTTIGAQFIGVTPDDNLIYVLKNGNPAGIYYLVNFSTLIYVGKTGGQAITPFGLGSGLFRDGKFYWGSNGFAGFGVNIASMAVACPEADPIVASVSATGPVAGGSSINVTFGTILFPDSTDRLDLRPFISGQLGFTGPSLAHLSTGSAASGTLSFTIPGGTTPGQYIIELTTEAGTILMATTAPFTVT